MIHGDRGRPGRSRVGSGPGRASSAAGWPARRAPAHAPHGPRPGQGQPAAARLRRVGPARPRRRWAARQPAPAKRALYLVLADRARPRPAATWRSPPSCASSIPTWRSTGWPSTRSRAVLEAAGERDPPGQRAGWPTSRPTSRASRPSTTCTAFQAIRRMDEILLANFMVFHDVVRERALRPVDRRRGLGARLLPAREPRAEAGRLRLADRLRRLAADARRRRAARRS